MNSTSTTSSVTWYRRPRPNRAPDGFAARLEDAIDLLKLAASYTPCAFAQSLSAEDMVIFHLIAEHNLPIQAIALDTGRLPEATLELWNRVEAMYSRRIERIEPTAAHIEELVDMRADSGLYESKTVRAYCCELRKTAPLRAALSGKQAWVTGLRRAQSTGRANVGTQEFDTSFQLLKFNPLINWADEDVWFYIDKRHIPHNSLYEIGYASIGCDPCTRPIRENEHPRAGRWWWEQSASDSIHSECGIHVATFANSTIKDVP